MEQTYLVYSTKFQGWVNQTGTYGTARADAKLFRRSEAFDYCANRIDRVNNVPTCLPVLHDDLLIIEDMV